MPNTHGTPTPTLAPAFARLSLYRALRRVTGPVMAFRMAFAGRAAQ